MDAVENTYLLHTGKLQKPSFPPNLVCRDRLLELIERGVNNSLTTLVAPAGYGKTTLLCQWANQDRKHSVAWYEFDASDSDSSYFIQYLVLSIEQSLGVQLSQSTLLALSPKTLDVEHCAQVIIDELHHKSLEIVVILDCFERVANQSDVNQFIAYLCVQNNSPIRVILSSRQIPNIVCSRFKAHDLQTDINTEDLRFSDKEAATLLTKISALETTEDSLRLIQKQLQGWAVGLKMLGTLIKRDRKKKVLADFRADCIEDIQQYLFEEVLNDLNQATVEFLLLASIPRRFSEDLLKELLADLYDSPKVTSINSIAVEEIKRRNLFIYSVGENSQTYEFHPLFRDLLQRKSLDVFTQDQIKDLHHISSRWFELQGSPIDAINEALMENDEQHATELVVKYSQQALNQDHWYRARDFTALLPMRLLLVNIDLLLIQIWIAGYQFDPQKCSILFKRLIGLMSNQKLSTWQSAQVDYFTGQDHFFRGDLESAGTCFSHTIDLSEEDGVLSGEAFVFSCLVRHMAGKPKQALLDVNAARNKQSSINLSYSTRIEAANCFLEFLNLKPWNSLERAKLLTVIGEANGSIYAQTWGMFMQSLIGFNTFKRNEAIAALERVVANLEFMEARMAIDTLIALAIEHALCGDAVKSQTMIEKMEQFSSELVNEEYIEIANSGIARVNLILGNTDKAFKLVKSLSIRKGTTGYFFWCEEPAITAIRVEVVVGDGKTLEMLLDVLSQFRTQIEDANLNCYLVDLWLIEAYANYKLNRMNKALMCLKLALDLAEDAHWVRPFVEFGHRLSSLLLDLKNQGYKTQFVDVVIRSIATVWPSEAKPERLVASIQNTMSEDLTNRETEILELLGKRYQNKEIANELFISIHTVNYHLKNIYQKLGVGSRREAVQKSKLLI